MRNWIIGVAVLAAGIGMSLSGSGLSDVRAEDAPATAPATQPASALGFTVKDIDGKDVDLSTYKGKVVMIVNVASLCGNTPQYKDLEEMYEKNKDQGFVVLGFPANDFHAQEPGTDASIKEFCTSKYHVQFPMFSKITVLGNDAAPLYKFLTAQKTAPVKPGNISWNFEKFIIGRDGNVAARFAPGTKPSDPKVVAAVDAELAKAKP